VRRTLDKVQAARHIGRAMTLRLSARWIAALTALLPLPALAQAQPATSVPANSVRCVEEALSSEDREIAMVLMFVRYGKTAEDRANWLRGMVVAQQLLSEASGRCRTAHRWTRSQAAIARDYAFHSLVAEAMGQLVEADGVRRAAPIEAYFNTHRPSLARSAELSAEQDEAFVDYLVAQGWDREEESELSEARKYLTALAKRENDRRSFPGGSR
jgi:hypothetical protein